MNDTCEHVWVKIHEQAIIGGLFPIGWQCERCNRFVGVHDLTPDGLSGTVSRKHKLCGVHGGAVVSGSGRKSKYQIYDEATGQLEYGPAP